MASIGIGNITNQETIIALCEELGLDLDKLISRADGSEITLEDIVAELNKKGTLTNQNTIINKLDGLVYDAKGNALSLEDLKGLLDGIQTGQATYARQTTGLNNDQEILDKLSDGVIAKAVKSVQRGSFSPASVKNEVTVTTKITEYTVSISRVNTSKSFILINIYNEGAQNGALTAGYQAYIKSFTSTSITFYFGKYNNARMINWQLVEFY